MTKKIEIAGMSCQHCVQAVGTALRVVPGVAKVSVDLASGTAVVEGSALDDSALKAAVGAAGYKVVKIS